MAEKKKKYVVAPGNAFAGKNKIYNEGDEIDAAVFGSEERFKSFLNCKPPKIIEAPVDSEKEEKNNSNKLDRKELEKLVVENELVKKEQLASLKDDELEKILKTAGILT